MGKHRQRHPRPDSAAPAPFEEARNELFQHIIRCGVLQAAPEHQAEWFDETMSYFAGRYPELDATQMADLRATGQRFCAPPRVTSEEAEAGAATAA